MKAYAYDWVYTRQSINMGLKFDREFALERCLDELEEIISTGLSVEGRLIDLIDINIPPQFTKLVTEFLSTCPLVFFADEQYLRLTVAARKEYFEEQVPNTVTNDTPPVDILKPLCPNCGHGIYALQDERKVCVNCETTF